MAVLMTHLTLPISSLNSSPSLCVLFPLISSFFLSSPPLFIYSLTPPPFLFHLPSCLSPLNLLSSFTAENLLCVSCVLVRQRETNVTEIVFFSLSNLTTLPAVYTFDITFYLSLYHVLIMPLLTFISC